MPDAIIYARFSPRPPKKQGDDETAASQEDADTIREQLEVCQRYALMRSLTITDTIKDPETSARKTPLFEREGGSRLKFLPKGTHIICSKLDRMFRSTPDGLLTMEYFNARGLVMHFADQGGCTLDLSSPEGKFIFTMLLATASLEPDRTADRTSKAMKHRQSIGQRMTSVVTVPFGRMVDPDDNSKIIPCRQEIEAMNFAALWHEQGMSLRKIAAKLGPIRGKILSPQSVKLMIEKANEPNNYNSRD